MTQSTFRPSSHIVYLDVLKLLAAFCVVFLHMVAQPIYDFSLPASQWLLLNVYDSMSRFCVPLFFMASGAVFLQLERPLRLKTFFVKNVFKLVLIYVFWCAVYHAFELLVLDGAPLSVTLHDLMHGDFIPASYHLWFLPAMVGAYLCVPFLRVLCASQNHLRYSVAASVLFIFLPSFLADFPALLTVKKFLNSLLPFSALYPAAYMMVGSYLHQTVLKRKHRLALYMAGLLTTVLIIALTQWSFANISWYPDYVFAFYDYDGLLVFVQSCAMFVLVKQIIEALQAKAFRKPALLRRLVKYTFGSYLVHVVVLELAGMPMSDAMGLPAALSIPLVSVVVFVISMGVSWVLNHIPLVNKWLV